MMRVINHHLFHIKYIIQNQKNPEDPSKLKTPMRMEDNQKHAERKHDEVGYGDHLLCPISHFNRKQHIPVELSDLLLIVSPHSKQMDGQVQRI